MDVQRNLESPTVQLRGVKLAHMLTALDVVGDFMRDHRDRDAGNWVGYAVDRQPRTLPTFAVHWTEAGAIIVRAHYEDGRDG